MEKLFLKGCHFETCAIITKKREMFMSCSDLVNSCTDKSYFMCYLNDKSFPFSLIKNRIIFW